MGGEKRAGAVGGRVMSGSSAQVRIKKKNQIQRYQSGVAILKKINSYYQHSQSLIEFFFFLTLHIKPVTKAIIFVAGSITGKTL